MKEKKKTQNNSFLKKSMFLHTYLDLNPWFSLFKPNTFTTLLLYQNSRFGTSISIYYLFIFEKVSFIAKKIIFEN
jgi:hypothetical protein